MVRITSEQFKELQKRQSANASQLPNEQSKRSKYGNKKVVIQGIEFDSTKEGYRWLFLKDCERRGLITELQRQVEFVLIPDEYTDVRKQLKTKVKVENKRTFIGVRYFADFVYKKNGELVVEDVKGSEDSRAIDDSFFLKQKMMWYFHRIKIRIVCEAGEAV